MPSTGTWCHTTRTWRRRRRLVTSGPGYTYTVHAGIVRYRRRPDSILGHPHKTRGLCPLSYDGGCKMTCRNRVCRRFDGVPRPAVELVVPGSNPGANSFAAGAGIRLGGCISFKYRNVRGQNNRNGKTSKTLCTAENDADR